MSLKANILKPVRAGFLAAASLLPSTKVDKAEAQIPIPYYYPYNTGFTRPYFSGSRDLGGAGSLRALGYWAPIYNQQIRNPSRFGYPIRPNYRPYGQRLARPSGANCQNSYKTQRSAPTNSQNQAPTKSYLQRIREFLNKEESTSQDSPQEIADYEKELQKQINNAKVYSDKSGVYVSNLMGTPFHFILPDDAKTFKLPKADRIYRGYMNDKRPYFLVINDKKEEKKKETNPNSFRSIMQKFRGTSSTP